MNQQQYAFLTVYLYQDHLEDQGTDGDNITMNLRGRGYAGGDWIQLDKDRDQQQILINTVIIL
jgi:hypothetical protein